MRACQCAILATVAITLPAHAINDAPPPGGGDLVVPAVTREAIDELAEGLENARKGSPSAREAACRALVDDFTPFALDPAFSGHRIGLLGPSGSGKTTLLRAILRLIDDETGTEGLITGDPGGGADGTPAGGGRETPGGEAGDDELGWEPVELPIGRGQREIIVGDRSTGKAAAVIESFLHVRGGGEGEDVGGRFTGDEHVALLEILSAAERVQALEAVRRELREEILAILADIKGDQSQQEVAARCRQLNQISIAQRGVFDRVSRYFVALGRQIEASDDVPLFSEIPAAILKQGSAIIDSQHHLREMVLAHGGGGI